MDSTARPSEQQVYRRQACDNCRRRKIKCSRDLPCDKCTRLLLFCSYSDVLRRKGPKFRTAYPLAPIHPFVSGEPDEFPGQRTSLPDSGVLKDSAGFRVPPSPAFCGVDSGYGLYEFGELSYQLPPGGSVSPSESIGSASESISGRVFPYYRRLTPPVLLAHVNVYLKYLFPIMPVVRKEQLQLDSHQPEKLSSHRYAFMASLCAATHIQLKLDGAPSTSDLPPIHAATDGRSAMSGEELLSEAVRARAECDLIEDASIESLLTSFFLFAAYGNLDMQKHAWFYLCQTMSMAFLMNLHRETSYSELSIEEAEERRRVFWLLFVTERGYALQQSKPVILRSSIRKPRVIGSNDPILSYGFTNLISVFEKLPVSLFDWVSTGAEDSLLEAPPTSSIQTSLCKPVSVDGVIEIQQVDILVTQQWLQAMIWKLSSNSTTQSGSQHASSFSHHLPVLAGKSAMDIITSASQSAIDAHGIGMEQKLFDIGISVADVSRSLSKKAFDRLADSTIHPNELLWGILHSLERIRGSQSYLFPILLERCKSILGFDYTITAGNYLPPLPVSSENDDQFMNNENSWANGLPGDIGGASRVTVLPQPSQPPPPPTAPVPVDPGHVPSHLPFQGGLHLSLT